ncbi:putative thimet oligopeptidase, putative,metallo-peptidase, clan MA(E), family M3 [Trypanosoma cruzi]|nr:putative thimet oligopeptidase, putative,metallo-peptidase, clan MA(E), family M3 [Trypanosoma cruzi]
MCRARAGLPSVRQESHRTCARSPDSMPDVCLDTRNVFFFTPTSAWRAVCTTSSYSWTSFQYNLLTAARNSTCQIGMPHCWRDRAIVASLSAALLRGIPQCDGETV